MSVWMLTDGGSVYFFPFSPSHVHLKGCQEIEFLIALFVRLKIASSPCVITSIVTIEEKHMDGK